VLPDGPFAAIHAPTLADLPGAVRRWHGEGRTAIAVLHDFQTVRAHFPATLLLARYVVAHAPPAEAPTAETRPRARTMAETPAPDAGVRARDAA
jgi:zinc/manganese transport system ATP-binding protein